jgi:hypothetical protein
MKESGKTIKLMAVVCIFIWTVQNTLEIGKKTNNTDMELKHGLMVHAMKVIMSMVRNMVPVLSNGLMALCTLESFTTTIFMVKVFTPGQMVENTRANGEATKCMGKALLLGQTEGSTLVNMLMIKNKVMESSSGLTVVLTKETGLMVNSMVKASMLLLKESRSMENGKKVKESDGLEKMKMIENNPYILITFNIFVI